MDAAERVGVAAGYPAWAGIDPSGLPRAVRPARLPRVGGDRPSTD